MERWGICKRGHIRATLELCGHCFFPTAERRKHFDGDVASSTRAHPDLGTPTHSKSAWPKPCLRLRKLPLLIQCLNIHACLQEQQ